MGVCAAWEEFLEASMVRYLAGAKTDLGYAPQLQVAPCRTILRAYQLLSGRSNYDPEQNYLTWTIPSIVVKRAESYFVAGDPYRAPLQREADRLKQAVKLRNRVAHGSTKCRSDFKAAANAVRRKPPETRLGQGFRAGALLSEPAGVFFGDGVPALNISIFEAFMQSFERSAHEIVPP
jgi:hypothetical protein